MSFSFVNTRWVLFCIFMNLFCSYFSPLKWNLGIIAHPWCGDHSTSINACGVWGVRTRVQVSKREFHTHVHLNYTRVEILSYIKKKNSWLRYSLLRNLSLKALQSMPNKVFIFIFIFILYIYIYIYIYFNLNT